VTTNLAFGGAALIVPSFIGSKVKFAYLAVELISWQNFLKFGVKV